MNWPSSTYCPTFLSTATIGATLYSSFTGKELDAETGYSYFGARYYAPTTLAAWLSVDPMSDKYPSISPYAYCAWNPLKLVDPDGKEALEDWIKNNKTGQYEWNDVATSPTTTPQGYTYVGGDLELLADQNIQTQYNRQHSSRMGHSPNQGSNYVGFDRSVNSTEAYLFVSVRVRSDEHNVTMDNHWGKTFDGIDITCNVNQWSRNSACEPNSMTFNGSLIVDGDRGFHSQSPLRKLTEPTIYATGTIPLSATVSSLRMMVL